MKNSFLLLLIGSFLFGQTEPLVDIMHVEPRVFVLKNATVHIEPGNSISEASIIIRDGLIEAVGSKIKAPKDATTLDMNGAHIYAGFIDGWLDVNTEASKQTSRSHWIDIVHPEWIAADDYTPNKKNIKKLHEMGFTQIHAIPDTGIFRGQSSLIDLNNEASISVPAVSQVMDFTTRGRGDEGYPEALLGTIAVMRQALYDAEWYAKAGAIYAKHPDKNERVKENSALAALAQARSGRMPFMVKANDELAVQRAIDISSEFDLKLWIMGSGYEYRRLGGIRKTKPFMVLPLNFPNTPDISDPYLAAQYSTAQLKHWDLAPDNAREVVKAGVDIAFTPQGLKEGKQFRKNLSLAVSRGLSEKAALAALTTNPAKHFGLANTLGKIKPGYHANFVVVDGSYFDETTDVKAVWIRGAKYDVEQTPQISLNGTWDFSYGKITGSLNFSGESDHPWASLSVDTSKTRLEHLKLDGDLLTWTLDLGKNQIPGITRFRGTTKAHSLTGVAITAAGHELPWTATNRKLPPSDSKTSPIMKSDLKPVYPEGAFGFDKLPEQRASVFIQDATIWTSGPQGILENCDMLIEKGRIKQVGQNLTVPKGAMKINGNGKHVTAGLIDPHSHTAAASINEGSQSVTSEVRIQDVLDPDDINIYREIAGGLTTIHVLHGSANTVGGQSAVIKLRWGSDAGGLILKRAPATLKFALGENVKQSNWGDKNVTRYPQTRMGVEQILRDAFTRAEDYKSNLNTYNKKSKWRKTLIPPRKDLELDPLVEVLEGTRRAHVHSYRQDEILMMTRVADDFGFTLANLEHVLEGYKVADRMAEHGVGAATFSDWWAYKFEVFDAIPYNAILMQKAGVLVSFKSDSDELARRMNLEAAKGIKYGGMTEIEAMNTVTINPAKQLKINQWVGSLESGKDADFVVWSGSPLSTQSICEQTWIDGKRYFSLEENAKLVTRDQAVRQAIIQKILLMDDKIDHSKDSDKHRKMSSGTYFSAEGGLQ